ncbi:uncharacterized protein BDZ99DRAFT_525003 [Mytilinidion resinicola]|uniref:Uncharacterized protein n=1 Tax=Mytilinidion resinicola TaxID=574789 RepID=A0A6A6YBA7_9PEZI|nr:uncharacterized protein BDZ99DRAFT_525003 [Mytilinidion resinicola]KAF2805294.1 hypothetical protein BDZ99DRAFT_525003 [Mytilinidion resinicola]
MHAIQGMPDVIIVNLPFWIGLHAPKYPNFTKLRPLGQIEALVIGLPCTTRYTRTADSPGDWARSAVRRKVCISNDVPSHPKWRAQATWRRLLEGFWKKTRASLSQPTREARYISLCRRLKTPNTDKRRDVEVLRPYSWSDIAAIPRGRANAMMAHRSIHPPVVTALEQCVTSLHSNSPCYDVQKRPQATAHKADSRPCSPGHAPRSAVTTGDGPSGVVPQGSIRNATMQRRWLPTTTKYAKKPRHPDSSIPYEESGPVRYWEMAYWT